RATDVGRDEDRDLARRFAEARHLVAAGRHAEGLAVAAQLARRGSDTRERFRSSLGVARLAMNAGADEIARPILEALVSTVALHSLETWDPSLCARLYELLYRCLPADAPDRGKAFEILCRLDPGAALRARAVVANKVDTDKQQTPAAATPTSDAPDAVAASPSVSEASQPSEASQQASQDEESSSADAYEDYW
ncbi:MAG TPA: type VI secretion system domain-containing protein, partial [Labilithrix sp.]|nr:type VI secretion system domain-containing protein [Labilithrix sp.]